MQQPDFLPQPQVWKKKPGFWSHPTEVSFDDFKSLTTIDSGLDPEGYEIELRERDLDVSLGSSKALTYAWAHFEQWCACQPTPCGHLADAPHFPRRGFMLDVSRCKVPTRETLSDWVKLLAAFRYNELQLYTEHSYAYSKHECVWRDASPLTADDIRWLQNLCESQGISLVPNQNCFGHFERWIKHPAYRQYAESPDGFVTPWGDKRKVGSVLQPDEASFELVCGLLDELLPNFKSPWVNIGCDETFELGQGASKQRCESEGAGRVYTEFVARIMSYVDCVHQKRCQFWGDILLKTPEELKHLPQNAMALAWGYEITDPIVEDAKKFKAAGLDYVICPGSSSWRSFTGRTQNMRQNIQIAAQAAFEHEAQGLLLTDWGDNGHLQQNPVTFLPLAWCGLHAWHPQAAQWSDALDWCDQVAFAGNKGDSQCWADLGDVSLILKADPHNCNALFQLFQSPQTHVSSVSIEQLQACLKALEALPSPNSMQAEWQQTLKNVRLILSTALYLKGEKVEDLEKCFKQARNGHQQLWKRRNREGGLAESVSMYTEVGKQLNLGDEYE